MFANDGLGFLHTKPIYIHVVCIRNGMYVCVYVNWLIQIKDTKYKNSSKWKQKGIAETDTEYSNNFVYATIFAFFFSLIE